MTEQVKEQMLNVFKLSLYQMRKYDKQNKYVAANQYEAALLELFQATLAEASTK